jgi:hypothetical protein
VTTARDVRKLTQGNLMTGQAPKPLAPAKEPAKAPAKKAEAKKAPAKKAGAKK